MMIEFEVEEYSAALVIDGKRYAAAWGPTIDNGEWAVAGAGREPHRVRDREAAMAELTEIHDELLNAFVHPGEQP